MPLDHYVSQVHLKNFKSPALGERMYAVRKSDLKSFTPSSKAVCGINEGSTNAYLYDDRAVEEFLKTVEPRYNASVVKLRAGNPDTECVYTIAGFVAYVLTCSPAGMRVQAGPLADSLEAAAAILERQGVFPPPPPELAGTSLTELLRTGAVKTKIDPKYPQAVGINSIQTLIARFGNFAWEILLNDHSDSPFFTSDFPVAIEKTQDPRVLNRIVPLTPDLAIRIMPDLKLDKLKADFTFANFRCRTRNVPRQEVMELNRSIVRCAEDSVFYRDNQRWVLPFIAKNRHYRVEPKTARIKVGTGTLLISTLVIASQVHPSSSPLRG